MNLGHAQVCRGEDTPSGAPSLQALSSPLPTAHAGDPRPPRPRAPASPRPPPLHRCPEGGSPGSPWSPPSARNPGPAVGGDPAGSASPLRRDRPTPPRAPPSLRRLLCALRDPPVPPPPRQRAPATTRDACHFPAPRSPVPLLRKKPLPRNDVRLRPAPARGGAAPALAPKPAPLCTAHPARPPLAGARTPRPHLLRPPRPHVLRGFEASRRRHVWQASCRAIWCRVSLLTG